MLYLPPGVGSLQRCHGAFVSDDEVDRVTSYLKEQVQPGQLPVIDLTPVTSDDPWSEEQDEYYDRAVELVVKQGKASTSMIPTKVQYWIQSRGPYRRSNGSTGYHRCSGRSKTSCRIDEYASINLECSDNIGF